MPHVADLRVYPVKSLPPTMATSARIKPSGALEFDRRWAFMDPAGRCWNSKRTPALHGLNCRLDVSSRVLELSDRAGDKMSWQVGDPTDRIEAWFSQRVQGEARLCENAETGFPDDLDSPGPTVISTATIETIADWFPGLTAEEIRSRLRANIEIGGVEPFWEDQLFGAAGHLRPFRVGPIVLGGVNPCARCVVPSRDSLTGQVWQRFQKTFAAQRQAGLPPWSERTRFDHYYRVAVNTRLLDGEGATIGIGDPVERIADSE